MRFSHSVMIKNTARAKEVLQKVLEHPNLYALGFIHDDVYFNGAINYETLNLNEADGEEFLYDLFNTNSKPYDLVLRAMAHINARLPKDKQFAEWHTDDENIEQIADENIAYLGGYFNGANQDIVNEYKSVLRELEAHIIRNEPKQYTHYLKLEKDLLTSSMTELETDDPTLNLKEIALNALKKNDPTNQEEFNRINSFTIERKEVQARPNFEHSDGRASDVYDYMDQKYQAFLSDIQSGNGDILTGYLRTVGHFYGISSNNAFLLHSQATDRGVNVENVKPFGAWAKMQNESGRKVSVLKGSKGFDFIKASAIPIYEKDEIGNYILDEDGKKIIATDDDGEERFFYKYIIEKRFDINQTNAKTVMGIDDAINEDEAIIQRLREILPHSSFEHKDALGNILTDETVLNPSERLANFFHEIAQRINPDIANEITSVFSLRLGRTVLNYHTVPYDNMSVADLKTRFKAITASVRYIAKEVGFEALLKEPIEYKPSVEDDERMRVIEENTVNENDVYIADPIRPLDHPSFKLQPFSYDQMFIANEPIREAIKVNSKDQAMIVIKNSILTIMLHQENFFDIVANNENLKNHYIELSNPNSDAMIALSEAIYSDIKKEQDDESARNQESLNGQFNDDARRSSDRNETDVSQGASSEQEARGISRSASNASIDTNESVNAIGDERNGSVGSREGRVHTDTLKSKGGLSLGESDGIKRFIGLNIDDNELFEDANGVRSVLHPSKDGMPSYYDVVTVAMGTPSRPSRSLFEQYKNYRLDYLTKDEFKDLNQEHGFYTEDGSSRSAWYEIERKMANEPLDSIFLKARLGIRELKETYGDEWTNELSAMWKSGMYGGLSQDKIPYIQRLKDIPMQTLIFDSKVPREQTLEVFYPLMTEAQKNAYQDTLDVQINNRTYELVEALGITNEQWRNNARYQKSEHNTNNIGMSIFGVQDDFRPIDEYVKAIQDSKEYQAFRNNYAESGYINIEELKRLNVEMDFHWSPRTLRQLKQELRAEDGQIIINESERAILRDKTIADEARLVEIVEQSPNISIVRPIPINQDNEPKFNFSKINAIYLNWSEALSEEGIFLKNFDELQKMLLDAYDNDESQIDHSGGYDKTSIHLTLQDDKNDELLLVKDMRIDVGFSKGDFNPFKQHIADHIAENYKQNHIRTSDEGDKYIVSVDFRDNAKHTELYPYLEDVALKETEFKLSLHSSLNHADILSKDNELLMEKIKLNDVYDLFMRYSTVDELKQSKEYKAHTFVSQPRVFDYTINEKENVLTVNNLKTFYNVDEIKEKFIDKQVIYQIFAQKYHFDLGNPVHVDILKNELNISVTEPKQETFTETMVISDSQMLRDYMTYLQVQYPRFIATSAISMANTSMYSNYLMMDEENNIRSLHLTHEGNQEWETLDVNTAKERLERAYFGRLIQEWGLDQIQEAQSDPLRSNPEIQKIFNKYKVTRIKDNEKYLEEVAEHYGKDSTQYALRKERYLKEEEGYETHFYTTLEDIVKTFDEANIERVYSRLYHGMGFEHYKRALEKIRDIDFGKTQKSSFEALDKYFNGGMTAYLREQKAQREVNEKQAKEREYLRELESERLNTDYGIMSRKEFYERIFADGWTQIDSEERGATTRYFIINPETNSFFDIRKKDIAFFESMMQNNTPENEIAIQEEPTEDLSKTYTTVADSVLLDDDNFVIQGEVVEGGQKTRFKNNLLAIEVIRKLEANQELNKDDKVTLSKYVGWGGIPQAFYRTDGSVSKGWEKEAEELKSALSKVEYDNARRSTLDAHYTPETVIKAIWASVDRLGFKGGTIIDPSVGVAKFFGYMPSHLKPNTRILGVEIDPLTAKIAQTLYPKVKVTNMGFEDYQIDNASVDLVIGNPPFGSQKIGSSKNDEKSNFSIHNYFFAKSVDTLKEGGILAMVVSNAFLDAKDESARAYIANQANLVGAIRLPNSAFSEAGTEVTTDIVFLQKRKEGQENNFSQWNGIGELNDTPINSYFVNHPENLLGEWGKFGTMHQGGEPALIARENDNLLDLLNQAIKRLPKDIAVSSKVDNSYVESGEAVDEKIAHTRVGAFYHSLGKVYKRLPDRNTKRVREEITFDNEKAQERVLGMIAIAEIGDQLRMMQVDPKAKEDELEAVRLELNRAYDAFVKEHGFINNATNKRLILEDPRSSFLLSLERKYDKGVSRSVAHTTGQKPREAFAEKADIFTRRTQYPHEAPTSASDVKSAMLISLSEYAYLDLNYIASLVDKSRNQVIDELVKLDLIFEDPNEGWVTREEYLSGNVKKKLKETNDPRNIEALKTVIPADIPAVDINVRAGASWLPRNVIEDFAYHILGDRNASAYYVDYNASWNISARPTSEANFNYGTQRVNAERVVDAVLNNKQITVYDTLADGTQVQNHEATIAVANKIEIVRDRWNDWIWQSEERRETLGALYNEKFNVYAKRQFDGSHLALSGKISDDIINLRPHQKNGVWRTLQTKNALFDHTVGTGKTFTGIATIMEMRRTNRATKPLIVVPNHLTEQWGKDWMSLYPSANILVATKKDFEAQNRKILMARIATGDYDAIIIGHSQLAKIENDQEFSKRIMEAQIQEIQEAIDMIRREEGGDTRSVKDAERSKINMEARLEKLVSYQRDDNLTFKELGIDCLFVDEFDEFKNLEYTTRLRGVAGLGNPKGSKKAYDLMLKIRELHDRTDGKNVIGATGTPISNTIAEMYTLQRYLQNDDLCEQGLTHFDAWVKQYAEVTNEWELSPSGKYKLATRLSKFVNVPELMQQYRQFADVITIDILKKIGVNLPIPKLKGGKPINVVVDRSPEQAWYIGEPDDEGKYPKHSLVYRSENLPTDLSKDNMLKIMSEARKVSLDMRIMNPSAPDRPNSKINEAVGNMLRLYKAWEADRGTQLVFCDLSTPKKSKAVEKERIAELIRLADEGDEKAEEELSKISPDYIDALESDFSVYDDIKEKLIKFGVPENEIAFIHDANTDLQKAELFAKVNSGKVRFLFGSTAKMGAGTNVQERIVGLHNLDAPWRPRDLEQRDGRAERQGNALYDRDPENFEIESFRYATKNTLDSRQWQILENKAKFISQLRTAEMTDREVEDIGSSEAMNSAEMKALSSGNPLILEEMDLSQKIKKLSAVKKDYDRTLFDTEARIKYCKIELSKEKERSEEFLHDLELVSRLPEKFSIEFDGAVYDKREEAGTKVLEICSTMKPSQRLAIGKYGDFELKLVKRDKSSLLSSLVNLEISGKRTYEIDFDPSSQDAGGLMIKVDYAVKKIQRYYDEMLKDAESMREQIPLLEERIKPFPRNDELEILKERHREIMEQLKAETKKDHDGYVDQRDPNKPIESKIKVDWTDAHTHIESDTLLRKCIRNYDPSILEKLGEYRFVGNCLVLETSLDRNTYTEFRKVFETFGGTWDKSVQAVVFSEDGLKRMQGLLSEPTVLKKEEQNIVPRANISQLEENLSSLQTKHKGVVKTVAEFIRDAIDDGFNQLKFNETKTAYLVNETSGNKYPIKNQDAVMYAKLILDSQRYINQVAESKMQCTENDTKEVQNSADFGSEKDNFAKRNGARQKR